MCVILSLQDPLVSRCGYLRQAILRCGDGDGEVVELPASFPGGSEAFEVIGLYCYGDAVALDPFNVAAVRCAAEFLDVSGLGARCDLYINQVVLQSWDDALIVLQRCQPLLPVAEELLVVSRCVESLAFMACMEILDPDGDEQRRERDQPGLLAAAAARGLAGRRWDAELVKELAARDLWIKDLVALPFEFFRRIVLALRRQGMKEKYVSPVVLFYANKWVLSKKTHKFMASTDTGDGETDANRRATAILQGVIDLLPLESSAATGGAIPVSFYFALLARSITLELSDESQTRLRELVASNLQFARVDDLPLPEPEQDAGGQSIAGSPEVRAMESIVASHVSMQRRGAEAVAELWDRYIAQIVGDPKLRPDRLAELIGVVPAGDRKSHDHLYEAIDTYIVVKTIEQSTRACTRLFSPLSCRANVVKLFDSAIAGASRLVRRREGVAVRPPRMPEAVARGVHPGGAERPDAAPVDRAGAVRAAAAHAPRLHRVLRLVPVHALGGAPRPRLRRRRRRHRVHAEPRVHHRRPHQPAAQHQQPVHGHRPRHAGRQEAGPRPRRRRRRRRGFGLRDGEL